MSNILNKISSIEADDDVSNRALGLHPVDESSTIERITDPDMSEPLPAIISRRTENRYESDNDGQRWSLFLMLALALVWLIAAFFIANGFFDLSNLSQFSTVQLAGLITFVLFPLFLLGLLHITLKQLGKITSQGARLDASANALMKVDDTVVRRATEMSGVIKGEISHLNAGIDTALTRAATLQSLLDDQMEKLGETSYAVEDKTKKITERLSTEREALWAISNTFDEQMKVLTETLDTHSENLALSTKQAEQKIQEARVSVESTAAKINTTAELVRSNTMEAASTLTDNQTEILRLSEQLKSRADELDTIYQKHGENLNAMIAQLHNEQESLSQSLEERLSKMRDVALSAQVSAERLTEASIAGRETVTSLSEAAKLSENTIKQRFTEMEDMVKYSHSRAESISAKASRRVQDSLSQTRKEIARIEADMMGLQEKLTETPTMPVDDLVEINEEMDDEFIEEISIPETPEITKQSQDKPNKQKRGFLNLRPEVEDSLTSSKDGVSGLRPEPELETEIPYSSEDLEAESADIDEIAMPELDNLDLLIEDGLVSPAVKQADQPLGDQLRRTISEPERGGGWLKSIFGKTEKKVETNAIDAITRPVMSPEPAVQPVNKVTPKAPEPTPAPTPVLKPESPTKPATSTDKSPHKEFLQILEENGLGPNAIVDAGTIIEAVDARLSGGSKQMSITVANRLQEPVSHFNKLINSNDDLKGHAINFAVKFHHSLAPLEHNEGGLRHHFESEDGRLFLLCDAALNT